ncbi:MAG: AmmeMemoRadiSam system protein A [bacterium]
MDEVGQAALELARRAVNTYCREEKIITPPDNLPARLYEEQSGVFVTLKKDGDLRGCTGTFQPTRENIAREIIYNAIGSGFRDPRFNPLQPEELEDINFTVSFLSEPEEVKDPGELDPDNYGVIVEKGRRRGLLLPDLEDVDTVQQQLEIARRKAGIPPSEGDVNLKRFEVEKFSEG